MGRRFPFFLRRASVTSRPRCASGSERPHASPKLTVPSFQEVAHRRANVNKGRRSARLLPDRPPIEALCSPPLRHAASMYVCVRTWPRIPAQLRGFSCHRWLFSCAPHAFAGSRRITPGEFLGGEKIRDNLPRPGNNSGEQERGGKRVC